MIILSDAQAETVCGGGKGPDHFAAGRGPRLTPRTIAANYAAGPLASFRQLGPANSINLLIAPLINLSFVIAVNGGTAIGSDQSNTLNAILA